MRGKCALITGSTAGLGFAIADRLAAEGCRVVLNGLARPEDAERTRADLARKHGVDVRFHGADLSVPAQIADLMEFTIESFGGVDILVNNAVVRHFSPMESFPVEAWDAARPQPSTRSGLLFLRCGSVDGAGLSILPQSIALSGQSRRLCDQQNSHPRNHAGRRPGNRGCGYHLQCHCAWGVADPGYSCAG